MTLTLNGLRVECIVGDLPAERERPQTLSLDLALELADEKAAATDELADTVDYAALAEKVADALVRAKCRLVERAAAVALEVCLAEPRVAAARVTVTKAGAVSGLDSASVRLESARNGDWNFAPDAANREVKNF